MNKKGSIFDVLFVAIAIFIISIVIILCHTLLTNFFDKAPDGTINKDYEDEMLDNYKQFDYMVASFVIGSFLFVLVGAYLLNTHPVFLIAGIFFLMLSVFVSAIISNTFGAFVENSQIVSSANVFPITTTIMQYLPIEIMLLGFGVLIVLFIKKDDGYGL